MREHDHGGESPDITELTPREVDFASRLGAALRADAGAREDVEARVMRTIRAETGRPWWTRKHRVTISPLGGFALAASFAGFIVLGTLAALRGGSTAPSAITAQGRVDTVHLVRFIIQQPGAQRVSLVGDFNGWAADAMPLESSADGSVWTLTVPLQAGRYEYAFVVDGKRWVADPAAGAVRDEFGGETSVLRLTGGDRAM